MHPALIGGGLAAVVGAGVIASSLVSTRKASIGAVDYVRSLDTAEGIAIDALEPHLADPVLVRLLRPISSRILGAISSATPGNHRDRIRHDLTHAGLSGTYRPEEVIVAEVALALFGLVIGLVVVGFQVVSPTLGLVLLLVLPVAGAFAPVGWLSHRAEARQAAVLADLPDTLDLLAISVEAGVGLEGALGVVCEQFDSPLADEFSRTLKEMELGLTRRDALQNLKNRTDVPELGAFVTALVQADALGMSIGRVLKIQAGEMRAKRRQWAREKAAKLPVKIIFPLVMCIFPSVLIVVIGPAASGIAQAFK